MASAVKPFDYSKLPAELQANAQLRTEILRVHDDFQVNNIDFHLYVVCFKFAFLRESCRRLRTPTRNCSPGEILEECFQLCFIFFFKELFFSFLHHNTVFCL